MSTPFPPPLREAARLSALYRYEILDTPPEKELDDLVQLAAYICNTPISLISLVDSDRQWFKSKIGLTATETSRYIAFCSHTILEDDLLIVPDALADERFANNPLVTGDPHVRFYCGAPLITPDGYRIGALNVIDHVPRELSAEQLEAIRVLSRQVMDHLILDRAHRELIQTVKERQRAEGALRTSEAKFRTLSETTSSGIYVYSGGRFLYANPAATTITGYRLDELLTMSLWDLVHPDFQELLQARVQALQQGDDGQARLEFKIVRKDGQERWLDFTTATIDYGGQPAQLATGYDITKRKQGEVSLKIQSRILELIAVGTPLRETLDTLVRSIEAQSDGMLASILLLDADGVHVRRGAAPSLPESFIRAIDGQPIGPSAGSCGTAAFRREVVIVEDIATDPLWINYRDHALPHGLHACWSTPIFDTQGLVLGTFALYFRTPGRPTARHIRLVGMATHIAAIAIDRDKKMEMLVEREALMRLFIQNSPAALAMFDRDMRYLTVSRRWMTDFKLGDGPLTGRSHYEVFPDLPQRWKEIHRRCLAGAVEESEEDIFVHADGRTDWLRWKIVPWRTASGGIGGIVIFTEDITDRKQSEAALRRNGERLQQALADASDRERLLQAIFDSEPECVKLLDAQGMLLSMNRAGLEMLEADSFSQLKNHSIYPLVTEEYREPFRRLTEAVFQNESGSLEFEMVGLKGTRRILETHACPLRDQKGAVQALLGITRDITDKRRVDEALRVSEARLQAILDNSPLIVFLKDRDGRYLFVNRMFERRFDLSCDQVVGKTDDDLFSPEQASAFRTNDLEVLRTGLSMEFEEAAHYEDGGHISIVVKFPVRDAKEEIYAIGGFVTDITERKKAEEQAHRWQQVFERAMFGLAYGNITDGTLLAVNEAFASQRGYRVDELIGQSILSIYAPDVRDEMKARLPEIDRHGHLLFESVHQRKDGTTFPVLMEVTVIRDTQGKPISRVAYALDITDRNRAYEALQESYRHLQALSREVQIAQERERSRLSRELHDEFGQLLSALKFDLNDIAGTLLKIRSPAASVSCKKAKMAAGTVDRLFSSLREMVAALRPAVLEELGLVPAVQTIAAEVQERSGLHCHVVAEQKIAEQPFGVELEGALFRIAQELLTNVARHAKATSVTISLRSIDGWVTLVVEDDGKGFRTRSALRKGRFGLRGVQERAELLGGRVEIRSEPGSGTVVTVRLPVTLPLPDEGDEAVSPIQKSVTARKRGRHGEKV